jgi:hypothetical protein
VVVKMARPERFELPTTWFVARYSIQLSYGRKRDLLECDIIYNSHTKVITTKQGNINGPFSEILKMAEREGFEPSIRFRHIHP